MSGLAILGLVVLVIVVIIVAIIIGMFIVINYAVSPKGFIKDLTNPDHEAIAKKMNKKSRWEK